MLERGTGNKKNSPEFRPASFDIYSSTFSRSLYAISVSVNFTTGDRVKILTGPFSGIEGSIDAMNDDTQTATVLCILFGRETPTEIAYNDLEKVEL